MRGNGGQFDGTPNVTVLAQLPTGGFAAPANFITVLDGNVVDASQRGTALAMGIGDVNGDHRADVVVTSVIPTGFFVGVLAQQSGGGLAPVQNYPMTLYATEVSVADVDGDGRSDIVLNDTIDLTMAVMLQQPNGLPGPQDTYATADSSNFSPPQGISVNDVNGDGRADVVLLDGNHGAVVFPGVASLNTPPVANAGVDQRIEPKERVTLNGTGSFDQDGTLVKYSWQQTSGPTVALSGSTTLTPRFVSPAVKKNQRISLDFMLTVTDNKGATASDGVTVTVVNK